MLGTWSERFLDLLPAALFTCFVAAAVHLFFILKRSSQQKANDASRPSMQLPKTPPLTGTTPSTQPQQQAACSSTRLVEYVLNDSATSLARSSSKPMASAHSGDGVATLLEESPYAPNTAGQATVATQSSTYSANSSALSPQQQINVRKTGSVAGRASLAQVSSPAATKAASVAATGANFNMVLQRLESAPALPLTPTQSGHPSAELHSISDVTVPKVPLLAESAAAQPQVGTAGNRHVKGKQATTPAMGAAVAASLAAAAGAAGDAAMPRDVAKPPAAAIDLGSIQRQLQSRGAGAAAAAAASTPIAMQRPAASSMGPAAAAAAAALPGAALPAAATLPGAQSVEQAVAPATAPAAARTATASRVQLPQVATYPAGPAVRPVRSSALYTSPMQHITVSIKVPLPFAPSAAHALQDCVSQHVISSAAAQQPPQHTIMHMVSVPGCIQLLMSVVQWRENQQSAAAAAAAAARSAMVHAQQQQASATPQRQLGMLGLASSEAVEAAAPVVSAASVVSATSTAAPLTQQQIAAQPYTSITTGERVVSSTLVSGPAAAVATPAPDWMVHAICRGVEQFMQMHAEATNVAASSSRLEHEAEQAAVAPAPTAADARAASSSSHSAAADSCISSGVPCEPYRLLGAPGPTFSTRQLLQPSWPGTSALIDINGQRYQLQPDPFDDAAPWGLQLVGEEHAEEILADMSHHDKSVADIVTGANGGTAPAIAATAAAAGGGVVGAFHESSAALHGSTEVPTYAYVRTAYATAEERAGGLILPAVQERSHAVMLAAAAGTSSSARAPSDGALQPTASAGHVAPAQQLAAVDKQLAVSLSHASEVHQQEQQEQQVPASHDMAVPEAASQDFEQSETTTATPTAPAAGHNGSAATQPGSTTAGGAPSSPPTSTIAAAPPTLALQSAVPPGVWVWPLYLPTTPTSSSSTACSSWMPEPVPFGPRPAAAAAAGLSAGAASQQLPPVVAVHGLTGSSCHFVVATTSGEVLADCPCTAHQGIARMQPEPCSAVAKRTLYCLTPHNPAAAAAAGGSSSAGGLQAHPRMDPAADKVLFALPVLYLPPAVVHELNESARAVLREQAHRQLIEQQEHAAALGSGPNYIYVYASEMPAEKKSSPSSGDEEDKDGLGSVGSSSRHLGSFDTLQVGSTRASSSSTRSSSSSSSFVRSSSSRHQRSNGSAADGSPSRQRQQQRGTGGQQGSAAGSTAEAAAGGRRSSLAGRPSGSGNSTLDDDDQHMVNLRGRLFAGEDVQNLYLALLADVGLLIDLAATAIADPAGTSTAAAAAAAANGQLHGPREGSVSYADDSVHGGSSNSTSSTAGSTIAYVSSASSEASKHMAATVGQQLLSWGASESAWNFCQLVLMLLDAIGVLLQMHGQTLLRENFATAAAVQQILLGQVPAGVASPAAAAATNGSNAVALSNTVHTSQLRGRFVDASVLRPPDFPESTSTAAAASAAVAAAQGGVVAPPIMPSATAAAALQLPRTSASAAAAFHAGTDGASASGGGGDNRLAAADMALPAALQRAPTPSPHQLQLQLQMHSQGLLSETASVPLPPLEWWDSARSAAAAAATAAATRQPSMQSTTGGAAAVTQAGVVTSMSVRGTAGVPATREGTSGVHASQEGTTGGAAAKDGTAGVCVAMVKAPPSARFSAESSAHTAGSSSGMQSTIALSSGASSDVPVVKQQRLGSAKSLTEHGRRFRLSLKDSASDMFSRLLRRQDKGQKPAL